jgi:hypothetical protein
MKRQAPLIDFYRHQRIDSHSHIRIGSPPWAQQPWREQRRWAHRISPWWQIHLKDRQEAAVPFFVFGLQGRYLRLIPIDAAQQRTLKTGDSCDGQLLIHKRKIGLKGVYQRVDAWSSSFIIEPDSRDLLKRTFAGILAAKKVAMAPSEIEPESIWSQEEKEYLFPLGMTLRFSKRKSWVRASFAGFFFEWTHSRGISTGHLTPRGLPEQEASHFLVECAASYDSRPHAQWSQFIYSVIENARLNGHDQGWLLDSLKAPMASINN